MEHTQNESAMKAVIDYVSQDSKTLDTDGRRYLSGVNCVGEIAYDEFMATKNLFGKAKGTYFYHYTQSFMPGEIKSYDEAHCIGIELAEKYFAGCEVLIGTHLDATSDGVQRIHNHFVINSVSPTDGRKVHFSNHSLEEMRKVNDRICAEHQLSVLKPFVQHPGAKSVGTREYRAALRGQGWKYQAMAMIEDAMTVAGTREEFCSAMASVGYDVNWSDTRKYITYTCPNGMKVRDVKLHEDKYLKERMDYEFRIRSGTDKAEARAEELKARARARATNQTMTNTPYQPIVYAIPQKQWEDFIEYLRVSMTFQPELYKQIGALATKEQITRQTQKIWDEVQSWSDQFSRDVMESANSIVPKVRGLLSDNRDLLQQDGSARDKFISDLDSREQTRLTEYENLLKKTKRWIFTAVIAMAGCSALLSLLITLLLK